jgi:WD40 repeat protein
MEQPYNYNGYDDISYGTVDYDTNERYDESQVAPFDDQVGQVTEPVEGMWTGHCNFMYEPYPVTSMSYDGQKDLLWTGHMNGRVTSFAFSYESAESGESHPEGERIPDIAQPQRYSSFMASDSPIFDVISLGGSIATVSQTQIRLHTEGGLSFGTICSAESLRRGLSAADDVVGFSGGAAVLPSGGLATSGRDLRPTHIIAGSSTNHAYAFDVHMVDAEPVVTYDVGAPTVCVRSSGSGIRVALGGADGKVRLLDGRLRSRGVDSVLEAHSGAVSDVCLQPDGVTMLTCGVIGRPVNPFDAKSPVNVTN